MPQKNVDPEEEIKKMVKFRWMNLHQNKNLYWYALTCAPCHERRNVELLKNVHIEGFVPIRRELHQWSDRKKWVDVVLTPRYIFVKMKLEDCKKVYVDKSICGIVYAPGKKGTPCPIPDTQMQAFIDLTQRTSNISIIQTPIAKGDHVRVVGGVMEGFVGECLRIDGTTNIIVRLNGSLSAITAIDKKLIEKVPELKKKQG